MTIVTAAVIFDQGKVVITQRKEGTNQEYKWEFPGGKLEMGESPEKCLEREIKEELGINIEVEEAFDIVYYEYPTITILLLVYKCSIINGQISAIDCNDYKWVKSDKLYEYEFAEADIPIVEKIIKSSG